MTPHRPGAALQLEVVAPRRRRCRAPPSPSRRARSRPGRARPAGGFESLLGVGVVAIEDEVRVEVAVAGMAEGGARARRAASRSPRSRRSSLGHPRCAARRRPPSGPSPAARAPGAPAAAPGAASRPPGASVARTIDVAPAASQAAAASSSSATGRRPRQVGLDHQHRLGVAIEPQVVPVVDRRDRRSIHELQRHRHAARRRSSERPHRRTSSSEAKKASIVERAGGVGRSRSVASVIRPERALRARRTGASGRSRRRP